MGDGLLDVLYTESLDDRDDTTDAGKLRTADKLWDVLRALALSPQDSLRRIQQYIGGLNDADAGIAVVDDDPRATERAL
jgi:hypothetical protein